MRNLSVQLAAIAGISLIATQAQAAVCDSYAGIDETALEGATVCFVYDPTNIDAKYGTPSVAGDTIFVTPTGFRAISENTTGSVTVSGTGTIQVVAKPGYVLDGISFGEIGDYRLTAGAASVDVDPYLRVFDWADPDPIFGTDETLFVPVTGDLTIKDGNLHNWSAAGSFDLTTPLWDGVNRVGLTLQNTLNVVSLTAGESAMIQKKAIGSSVDVSTSPVPVPAALWLFGSGLLGLVGVARRRR